MSEAVNTNAYSSNLPGLVSPPVIRKAGMVKQRNLSKISARRVDLEGDLIGLIYRHPKA